MDDPHCLCMDGRTGEKRGSTDPKIITSWANMFTSGLYDDRDLCHHKVMHALLTSGIGYMYVRHTVCSPFPPACACVCGSGGVTSVRTRSWLLWRWRRGRQRRNMTHGKLSGSYESGSRVWPRLWKRARSLRWKPRCISARSFARLARSPAAHPGAACSPSGFLAEDARLRLL